MEIYTVIDGKDYGDREIRKLIKERDAFKSDLVEIGNSLLAILKRIEEKYGDETIF